jgi:hypothetical protein
MGEGRLNLFGDILEVKYLYFIKKYDVLRNGLEERPTNSHSYVLVSLSETSSSLSSVLVIPRFLLLLLLQLLLVGVVVVGHGA